MDFSAPSYLILCALLHGAVMSSHVEVAFQKLKAKAKEHGVPEAVCRSVTTPKTNWNKIQPVIGRGGIFRGTPACFLSWEVTPLRMLGKPLPQTGDGIVKNPRGGEVKDRLVEGRKASGKVGVKNPP